MSVPVTIGDQTHVLPTLTYREQMDIVKAYDHDALQQHLADLDEAGIKGQDRAWAVMEWRKVQLPASAILRIASRAPDRIIEVAMKRAGHAIDALGERSIIDRVDLALDLIAAKIGKADDGNAEGKVGDAPSSASAP